MVNSKYGKLVWKAVGGITQNITVKELKVI